MGLAGVRRCITFCALMSCLMARLRCCRKKGTSSSRAAQSSSGAKKGA